MIAKNVVDVSSRPDDYAVYEKWIDVAGVQYRKADATRFVKGRKHSIILEPEPTNQHSTYAIKVIGTWRGLLGRKRAHIGYVPDDCAKALAKAGVQGRARARVIRAYLSDEGFVDIRIEIIGPADRRDGYRAACST